MTGRGNKKTCEQATRDCLKTNGPMTLAQIAGNIHHDKAMIHSELQRLLTEGVVAVSKDKWALKDAVPRYPKTPAWTKGPPIVEGWWR